MECERGHELHESYTLLAMMKKRFGHLIEVVKNIDFEKDGTLSRENIFKLFIV